MAQKSCSVIVPGSTMLLGEHAVLVHGQAIVAALNKYIEVTGTLGADNPEAKCKIVSSNFATLEVALNNFVPQEPCIFVLQALKSFANQLPKNDLLLTINAQFSATLGFGSSSAVTVATVAVLYKLIYQVAIELPELFVRSLAIVREVQTVGSGADVAASVYGGVLAYNALTYQVRHLPAMMQFSLIYAGYKMPTVAVISHVAMIFETRQQELQQIYMHIHNTVLMGISALAQQNYRQLQEIFSEAYRWQQALGVSDQTLDTIIKIAGHGSKISGSGLGDCVITLNPWLDNNYQSYKLTVSPEGMRYV